MRNSKHDKKSFWKDKKNIAIIILSFLLLISLISFSDEDASKLRNEINT